METINLNRKTVAAKMTMFKRGFTVGFPIMLGYIPIAITYGVLAKQAGLSLMELTLMSVLVFAGASQFMGANMIALGAGAVEIIIATFVLNFRHFVMSLSFMNRLREVDLKWKFPLSLGLTDETFAVSSLHTNEAKEEKGFLFYGALTLTAYLSWVIGSFLGGVLGEVIPETLSQSMGIALYAMFIGLLIPKAKESSTAFYLTLLAAGISSLLYWGPPPLSTLAKGWKLIITTILVCTAGTLLFPEEVVKDE